MNPRQRFWKFANFEPIDHLPDWADWLGPWEAWKNQGLPVPEDAQPGFFDEKAWFIDYFGFDGMYSAYWGQPRLPVNLEICPAFETEIIEVTDDYIIYRGGNGVTSRRRRTPGSSYGIEQYLEYPVKTRRDWVKLRDEHLDPNASGRYPAPADWEAAKKACQDSQVPVSIDGGSFYGFLRNAIGVENFSYLFFDDPLLVHEMMDYLADLYIAVLRKAVSEVKIDFAIFWEDMCYKTGPLLSPAMFRKFMLPNYKKVTRFLVENGVELCWVDCDGNIEALLPLWLEGGVRGHYPLEVAAGMDAGKLQQQYGRQILMWGNVDKRALIAGKSAIDNELARLAPVAAKGGFIPLVDHGVPDDIPYQHYLYYLEQRRWLFGNMPIK